MLKRISIIIPIYNEEKNIPLIYKEVQKIFNTDLENYTPEIIFVDDGSTDGSVEAVESLSRGEALRDMKVRLIEFSRNFGKEAATTAGLHASSGDAVIMIDADLQHPPRLLPEFVHKWEDSGSEVIIGVRNGNTKEGIVKKLGSKLFYKILSILTENKMRPGETDFRLVDRVVVDEFNKLNEHNRMTRALINWLGFTKEYIKFEVPARANGKARYTVLHLTRLAINSFVSNSTLPLEVVGYLGGAVSFFSFILGIVIFVNRYMLGDPFGWAVSGSGQLAVLITFLVGLLLMSIGIIGVYIGTISKNASGRPLYIIKSEDKGREG